MLIERGYIFPRRNGARTSLNTLLLRELTMLSIDVCSHCWLMHSMTQDKTISFEDNLTVCPFNIDPSIMAYSINCCPPNHCPYRFEHAVAAGVDNA